VARLKISDRMMWELLGFVTHKGDDTPPPAGRTPAKHLVKLERIGFIWLRKDRRGDYWIQVTREGEAAARKWAARCAEEYAASFSRVR